MKALTQIKKVLFFAFLLFAFSFYAEAQVSKEAKKLVPKYQKIRKAADTNNAMQDSAINLGIKIISAELAVSDKRDSLFVADYSYDLGNLMVNSYNYEASSATYFLLAANYYRILNKLELSGVAVSKYLYVYNVIFKYKKRNSIINAADSFLFDRGNQDTTLWLTVKADTIAWNQTRDTIFVVVKGGSAQGITENTRFDVFTTFDTFYNIDRKTILAGTGRITKVEDFVSYGFIPFNTDFKDTVFLTDAFEVKADLDTRWLGTPLTDVALYNIQLRSHDGMQYFSQGPGNTSITSKRYDLPLKLAMLKELRDAIVYYNTVDSTILKTQILTGPFKNYTYQKALEETTIFELDMFLDFLRSYPGKSINNSYNLIQKYMTWIINDCYTGHDESVIIEKILNIPLAELMANTNKYAGYYLQVSNRDSLLKVIINQRNEESAQGFLNDYERMQALSAKAGIAKTDSLCLLNISWQYHRLKDNVKALEWANKAWAVSKKTDKLWVAINKAIFYSEMDKNEDAIAMCDSALALDSNSYYARGYKGWNLIKNGKPKLAFPLCKFAFEQDSFVQWTIINYGHALYLKGNKEEANRLYRKSFEFMSTSMDYFGGLEADFKYFIKMGIQEDDFASLKNKYFNYYNDNYKFKLLGDSIKNFAINLKDKGNYLTASENYKKAREAYVQSPVVDWENQRLMTRWSAYCLYKNADYKLALVEYKVAAQITIDRGLGEDNLIADYIDVGHLYDWLNDTLREMEFESRAASMEVSLREKRDAKKLYLLTVGAPFSGHNDSFSVGDATAISTKLTESAKLHFDKVITHNVVGKNATIAELKKSLDSAIYTLGQNDVFVFYYGGWGKVRNEEFITLSDGDFSLKDLAGYLGQIPAGRQMHIADCNGLNWRKWYQNDNFGLLSNEKSSLVFLGLKNSRIEEAGMKHSVLTNALISAWDNDISQGSITASQWVASAATDLMNTNRMYAIEFQTFGHDFVIGKSKVKLLEKDTTAPLIELFGAAVTRSGSNIAVVSSKNVSTGSITDDSRIVYARANGIALKISENGRFELPKELLGTKNIVIEALDEFGNSAHREFLVSISDNTVSMGGTKFAYLFASQDYQTWSDLVNPLDDAKSIGDILKENYGYTVEVIKNPSKSAITQKLDFIRRYKYAANDQLLVFFAGHGHYDSVWGGFYVCPESQSIDKDPYFESFYPQQKIADLLDGSACKNVFLVMDVCFGGKMFDKQDKHTDRSVDDGNNVTAEEYIKRQLQIPCRQFLTSGGNNYVADGIAGNHSPFASRLIAALEDAATKNEYISASDIMDYLRTMRTIGNDKKSFPRYGFFGGDRDGEFVFKVMKKIRSTAIIAKQ